MFIIKRNNYVSGLKESFICTKDVGKCTLEDAVVVPNDSVSDIQAHLSNYLYPGNTRDVKVVIDDYYYNCSLLYANPQDRNKPSLQFRFKSDYEIAKKLKKVFSYSYNKFILKKLSVNGNVCCGNSLLRFDLDEKIEIFSTDKKDVFVFKCYPVYHELAA